MYISRTRENATFAHKIDKGYVRRPKEPGNQVRANGSFTDPTLSLGSGYENGLSGQDSSYAPGVGQNPGVEPDLD
jgi:hypothetical protein